MVKTNLTAKDFEFSGVLFSWFHNYAVGDGAGPTVQHILCSLYCFRVRCGALFLDKRGKEEVTPSYFGSNSGFLCSLKFSLCSCGCIFLFQSL